MKFISLFSGIGGLDLGLERSGMECILQVEIDDYCNKVLEKHWPNVKRVKDVLDVKAEHAPTAELIAGGFPCQDVSLAGNRAGLEGKRSTLWSEFYRLVCEVRPRWILIENVPGLYSANDGRFFAKILRELSESGYDAQWDSVPARAVGAPHRRDRVFIVAYPQRVGRAQMDFIFQGASLDRSDTRTWNGRRLDKPDIERVVDGVPGQLDRLRGCGNAVVPQVAEWIGQRIMDIESEAA